MNSTAAEAQGFRRLKEREAMTASARVAFFLNCGMDLEAGVQLERREKLALQARLRRLIERERLRGARRHWSYDLNRHIALKQAFDLLRGDDEAVPHGQRKTAPLGRRFG